MYICTNNKLFLKGNLHNSRANTYTLHLARSQAWERGYTALHCHRYKKSTRALPASIIYGMAWNGYYYMYRAELYPLLESYHFQ